MPAEWKTWAAAQGATNAEVEDQAARFADYWRSIPGTKGVKLDWQATWRNWIRSSLERNRPRNAAAGSGPIPFWEA